MQPIISAFFDSADEADRAVARLRRTIPYLQAKVMGGEDQRQPSQYSASLYFPWRIDMTANERGAMNTELGSRALLTSDLMGLPIYPSVKTEVQLKVDAPDADRAHALLRNLGASGIRILQN